MWGLGSCRWWPFVGLFLFGLPLLLGHLGFTCHRTDPGTTDPGVTTQESTNPQALAPAAPAPAVPSVAGILLPIGAGVVGLAAAIRARRAS